MSRTEIIAIVWSPHEVRTATFAKWLNARLYNIHFLSPRKEWNTLIKYPLQWLKTWYVLLKERPRYVYFCDSPPIAGMCIFSYCFVTRTPYIMDTHTPNLLGPRWGWTAPIQRFLARHARMNLVDQQHMRELFESWGAKVMVLENPPKNVPEEWLPAPDDPEQIEFTYIGIMARDEPIDIIIEAAKSLPHIRFYILGSKTRIKQEWAREAGDNVVFPGYLLENEFWERLSKSRGIIALTIFGWSLLGSAMDGLYIDKPMILSDQPTLRRKFTKGAVFVDNTAEGMVKAVETFLEQEDELKVGIAELRQETEEVWLRDFEQLRNLIRS